LRDLLLSEVSQRRFADIFLFAITGTELALLVPLTPIFTGVDWIYLLQHLWVMAIALTRRAPAALDSSLPAWLAVAVSMLYPYAQLLTLHSLSGGVLWPDGGAVLVTLSAFLSLASLVWIGRLFGLRPALRGLVTTGPYGLVRHPLYLAYMVSDVGYELNESNAGTLVIMFVGWSCLLYRIHAEEHVLSQAPRWGAYMRAVRYRLFPGLW
jgi:protein-S-isoprenylcysteine O-methyltransferase Ste14